MPLLSIKLIKMLHEASVLLLLLAALLLLLALFSFHPADSGWNGVSLPIANNLTGLAGSWLADFIFSLAGVAAWLFVVALVYLAVQLFYRPWRQANWSPFIPSIRSLGFVLLVIGTTAIAAGHSFAPQLPYGAGGILGESLAILVKPLLGDLGASLFFVGCFLLGLSLVTGWSWLTIMDEIGYFIVEQSQRFASFLGGDSLTDMSETPDFEPYLAEQPYASQGVNRFQDANRFQDLAAAKKIKEQELKEQKLREQELREQERLEANERLLATKRRLEENARFEAARRFEENKRLEDKRRFEEDKRRQALERYEANQAFEQFKAMEKKAADERLYAAALTFVFESRRASAFALQRHFELDYESATGLIERMERSGLVSSLQPNGQRRLLSSLSSNN